MSEYEPKIKRSRIIPFGYRLDEHDSKLLQPIPSELDALEEAMRYLRSSSYRDVRNWLVAKTGRTIAHKNLFVKHQAWKKKKYGRKPVSPTETQEG